MGRLSPHTLLRESVILHTLLRGTVSPHFTKGKHEPSDCAKRQCEDWLHALADWLHFSADWLHLPGDCFICQQTKFIGQLNVYMTQQIKPIR